MQRGGMGVARIGPDEARAAVVKNEALLVCVYDEDACKDILLEGAMLRSEFESKLASLPNSQTIIFYCGWDNEGSSARLAAQYIEKGYPNTKALKDGIDGWEAVGYSVKKATL